MRKTMMKASVIYWLNGFNFGKKLGKKINSNLLTIILCTYNIILLSTLLCVLILSRINSFSIGFMFGSVILTTLLISAKLL